MVINEKYPSLDEEDMLPAPTPEQAEESMRRKVAQIQAEEDLQAKKDMEKRMLKVCLTPRQDRLTRRMKKEWGMSASETVRRALDEYFDRLIARGDLNDNR